MPRAIITHTRGWHALAATRSLGKRGIEVFCGEEGPLTPCSFSRYCTESFVYPSVGKDPEGFIDCLVEKVQQFKPAAGEPYVLIPVHKETWLIAQHRERFEPHVSLALTSYENMARTHDKGRLALLAEEHGIPIPRTRQFRSVDDLYHAVPELSFPIFLKVREGAAGVGLRKCDTAEELTGTFKEFIEGFRLEPATYPLVQEFLPGDDYCVTVLFDRGRCVAKMTYRNVRAFPRGTGAGTLRETVELPDAEAAAVKLLSALDWHGMAELDFRKPPDGHARLIEINPRFFGGLHQAVAANVDYPHLLFRIASGEHVEETISADPTVRTEAPVVGLLATMQDIAHDPVVLDRFENVQQEFQNLGDTDVTKLKLRPLFEAIGKVTNPRDVFGYLRGMFEKHHGSIDDVLQADDPLPVLGMMFPIIQMFKQGKISLAAFTAEEDLAETRPRLRFRDLLARPSWKTLLLAFVLAGFGMFLANWSYSAANVAWAFDWPKRLWERWLGANPDPAKLASAMKLTLYHVSNLLWLYVVAAMMMRQRRKKDA